ncbi:MAG: hypothetical protein KGD67_10890 [Candidatus Lokiarchaeota archaeon]|nr:hypothetical protein [Candidatus Lokiarchaeota archaeon]
MVDWEQIADQVLVYFQEFISWFLALPLASQFFVILAAVGVIILSVVIVYYVIKGVAYLVYYILKGVYLLLKGIFVGIYKLFEEIYYDISGKPKPIKESSNKKCCEEAESPQQSYEEQEIIKPMQKEVQIIQPDAVFCSECGSQYTERMLEQLREIGVAYCVFCGKGYKSTKVEVEQY